MNDSPGPSSSAAPEAQAGRAPRRRRGMWILAASLLAVLAFAWFLTHRNPAANTHGRRPHPPVAVATAHTADIPVHIEALGAVTPLAQVTVQPQVSGVVTQVLYREGQMVAKGQVLATIDPRPFVLAVQQAEAVLARDQAQLKIANLTLARYRTLEAQDSIAGEDVDTQAATAKQLAGTVASDRATVGVARLNLAFTRIEAPVAGRVGLRTADPGSYVTPAAVGGIVTITQIAPIDVQFAAPQSDLTRIQARTARGAPPVAALDPTRTHVLAQGTFLTLDNAVDPTTGTVKAKARFANTDGALFPSQFVNVRLLLDTLKDAVAVPASAVRTGPNGDFVYVVSSANKVSVRPVVQGPADGDTVAILRGLAKGEKVVVAGGDQLTAGMTVHPAGAQPTQGGHAKHRPAS